MLSAAGGGVAVHPPPAGVAQDGPSASFASSTSTSTNTACSAATDHHGDDGLKAHAAAAGPTHTIAVTGVQSALTALPQ